MMMSSTSSINYPTGSADMKGVAGTSMEIEWPLQHPKNKELKK